MKCRELMLTIGAYKLNVCLVLAAFFLVVVLNNWESKTGDTICMKHSEALMLIMC